MGRKHNRKFMNGEMTPEECHQKYAFAKGTKCAGCGRPPLSTIRVLYPLDELVKRDGNFVGTMLMKDPEAFKKMCVETTEGILVRVSTVYACKSCTPAAERAAAKGSPSWCVVEINRGPGPDKLVTSGDIILA